MSAKTVDREVRSKMAILLRRFATGRISYCELETEWPEFSLDPALKQISRLGVWSIADEDEDDVRKPLNREQKRFAARVILFLKSDCPYRWPSYKEVSLFELIADFGQGVLFLITFGLVPRPKAVKLPIDFERAGNIDVWPFLKQREYDSALRNPPYLAGRKSENDHSDV